MKKLQKKKITVMVNDDLQKEMQEFKEKTGINWSEFIKMSVKFKLDSIKKDFDADYKVWLHQEHIRSCIK